ncbi:type IV pilus modification protein PilV [Microbulbifer epialgicus]|uniref:Type IV pilus modification protein PilV n=1 Tax=Microbulbifer epialgicus TaxID=393907 RepID=A0ABV4NXQ0_9GAMM
MRKQNGATLIEVLISVLVLAIGLLGLASTQMMSLKNGNGAHHRYMATLAAQEIIERIRANPDGFKSGKTYKNSDVTKSQDCSVGCSPDELAKLDLYEWGQLLNSNLPGAAGVAVIDSQRKTTVTITWTEQHTGKDYGGSSGGSENATFVMSVEL